MNNMKNWQIKLFNSRESLFGVRKRVGLLVHQLSCNDVHAIFLLQITAKTLTIVMSLHKLLL